jgi:BMFP domain-containing protein YqiC
MPNRSHRVFDDFSQLMSDAAGMVGGVRREAETAVRGQFERFLASMDMVSREEFEAVKHMAILARDENERLERKIAALEASLAKAKSGSDPSI